MRRFAVKMRNLILFSLALCVVGLSTTQALAFTGIGNSWRANYPDTCREWQAASTNATDCVLCPTNGLVVPWKLCLMVE